MTKITAVNVNNEGDGYLLFGNDDIRVDVGVSVISTGASAIACWEGAHVFRIFGTLHGEDDGLKMLGTAETCKVVIARLTALLWRIDVSRKGTFRCAESICAVSRAVRLSFSRG